MSSATQEEISSFEHSTLRSNIEKEQQRIRAIVDITELKKQLIEREGNVIAQAQYIIGLEKQIQKLFRSNQQKSKAILERDLVKEMIVLEEGYKSYVALLKEKIRIIEDLPVDEPEPTPTPDPTPEQKNIYWIIKPDNHYGQQILITESGKRQYEGQGWVFSLTEPAPIEPEPPIMEPIPEPIPEAIAEPQIDDSINTNMVTQQVINFNIINGRAVGSIKFVATNNFNSYYYNKEIINLVQFKTPNGVTLLVKENRLRFTETERDELITYDESVQENTRITVESFVWEWIDKPAGAFSNKYTIDISEKEPPKPMTSGFMGAGIAGAIAGLVLIGFIVDSKVGK